MDNANGNFTVADITTVPSATSIAYNANYTRKVWPYKCNPLTTNELESGASLRDQ